MAVLRALKPETLKDVDIHELANEALPVAYSLDHRDFVVLCAHDLDMARKRRAMSAEYDPGMAPSSSAMSATSDNTLKPRDLGASQLLIR